MKVLLTGATGYVGGAVLDALLGRGHLVTALVRDETKARPLAERGVALVAGDYKRPESYRDAAGGHDAFVHAAFEPNPEGVAGMGAALQTLIGAAQAHGRRGAKRAIVFTSGVWVIGPAGDRPAMEDAPADRPAEAVAWRPALERRALEAASDTLAVAAVRPGMVYGRGGGVTADFFRSAREEGAAALVGEGANRWTGVHADDLGTLYALAAERRATGIFHALDDSSDTLLEWAQAASCAAGAGGRTRSIPLEEARRRMGAVADALVLDQWVSSERTRRELGWQPRVRGFVAEVDRVYREWESRAGATTAA